MTPFRLDRFLPYAAAALAIALAAAPAHAGKDDDAPFQSDGVTPNAKRPASEGVHLADYATNADPKSGLRILPPTGTQLVRGQRFDLRVETQILAHAAPTLESLKVNGSEIAPAFLAKVAKQGGGLESGTPKSPLLLGATARNLSFDVPGVYRVEAVVSFDGDRRRIENTLRVGVFSPGDRGIRRVVFFLGDGMGLPVRTAARLVGRGTFEGRARGSLEMESLNALGLVRTASFDSVITDSAPGMASDADGMKQPNNALNASVDNTPETSLDNPRVETLWELLKRTRGWKTGVVTDAYATDATPAAVSTHTRQRKDRQAIAQQMIHLYRDGTAQPKTGFAALSDLTQPLDVILGGGAVDWVSGDNPELGSFYQYPPPDDPKSVSKRRTDVDLLQEAPKAGYSVVRNAAELKAAPVDRPLLGIFTGEFRTTSTGLGPDNLPGCLDRLVARGEATIGGKDASAPEIGMSSPPPFGTGCGATIADCFRAVPAKLEMVQKAVAVLDRLAGKDGGWILLVEQSQTDKLGHVLEFERVVYEALELDGALGWVRSNVARDGKTLLVLTADHAQPESTIGVVMPASVQPGGAIPPGGCFTPSSNAYPIALGKDGEKKRPCPLQDAVGTFDDAAPPTYVDRNGDGFPDDPDPTVKLVIDDAGRPTYTQSYTTDFQPLEPADPKDGAIPNPKRDPDGLLMTGNMPTSTVEEGANRNDGNVSVAPHSGDDVPLVAAGPGDALFDGFYENTDILPRLAAALSGVRKREQLEQGGGSAGVPATSPPARELRGL